MKAALPLVLLCVLAGCLDHLPVSGTGTKSDPPAPQSDKIQVTQAQFFTVFAKFVEDGNIDHTQRVVTECTKGMHRAGVATPDKYDAIMADYVKKNVLIDDTLRKKLVADLRGFAK